MIFTETRLKGSYVITLTPVSDDRGWFARTYSKDKFHQIGHEKEWAQMNHSVTYNRGSIRGMHYQMHPFKEIKLVRCIAGSVYDVIIDLRKDSPTLMQWIGVELSASNGKMMYIPEGFAHGFQTLTNNCELIYHHTAFYTPAAEAGVYYDDPQVNIQWPLPVTEISERDKNHPNLAENFKGI